MPMIVTAVFAVMAVGLASIMFITMAPPIVVAVTISVPAVSILTCIAGAYIRTWSRAYIRSWIVIGLRVVRRPCP